MTQRKTTPKKRPTPKRVRGVTIQVYVSREERAQLRIMKRKRGVSLSTLVRDWIRRSAAASIASEPKPAVVDPRQLRIGDASLTVLREPTAASQFVVLGVPCCDSPLLHVGIHDGGCRADGASSRWPASDD
jgi:hypothetical protein